jgi:transcriptional regulator with XRE-family HTH domain
VTIGDALAEARRQAGLTITQVSQRTCIRETIIRGIERNDFSACGGDFYARGHIRSIARAVNLEPEPLIREYDATQGAPEAITAADVFEPSTPIRIKERRRPNWSLAMLVALAAIVGIATYHFLSAPARTDPVASGRPPAASHPRDAGSTGQKKTESATTPARPHHRHHIVIALSAVSGDCWVELTTVSGQLIFEGIVPAGTSRTWTAHHSLSLTLANPGAVTLTVNGKTRQPGPAGQAVTLSLRSGKAG